VRRAAKMVRNVSSGGEGLYRITITGSSTVIGVKSIIPGILSMISTMVSGHSLKSE
jgi:hypothetical protein